MNYLKFAIVLLIFGTIGCATFDASMDKIDQKTNFSTCSKKSASFKYFDTWESIRFDAKYVDPHETHRGDIKNSSFFVSEQLKFRNVFNAKMDQEENGYNIEFQPFVATRTSSFEKAWGVLSLISIGVIPSYSDGYLKLNAIVTDNKGKMVKKYESSVVEFKFVTGIIIVPFIFFHSFTLASVKEQYFPKLTDEILNQMINDKLACETSMEIKESSN